MADLAPMTPAAAQRFLAEQPYQDRIHVSLMGKHGGFQPVPVLSAVEFVRVATGLNPVVSADALADWVADKLGDVELGQAIRAACAEKPLFEQASAACAIVAERLEQAQEALVAPAL